MTQLDMFPNQIEEISEKMSRFVYLKKELASYGGRGFSFYPLEYRIEVSQLRKELLEYLTNLKD